MNPTLVALVALVVGLLLGLLVARWSRRDRTPAVDLDAPEPPTPPLPEGVAIGDPARIVEEIERWDSVGIDGINFMLNAMEQIPQQQVLDSMRLFAAEVMPKFRR